MKEIIDKPACNALHSIAGRYIAFFEKRGHDANFKFQISNFK